MRALVLTALIGLAISPPSPGADPAQASAQGGDRGQYTIAVDVELVVFNVSVTDSKGRHVAGLKATDFRVREMNRVQDIKVFTAEDLPVTIGLIIDNSGSMQSRRSEVVDAALVFAAVSHPDDEMFVINFNERVYMGLPSTTAFTSSRNELRTALVKDAPSGLTALYDALAAGIEHLKRGTQERKALVVLSDGGDNSSRHRLDDVLEMAKRSNATIHTIGIYDESNQDRNPRVLKKIAEVGGGRAYFPATVKDLDRVWRNIAGAIRSQYTIGYHSSNGSRDGLFRKVEITAGRGRQVGARDGYFGPTGEPVAR